MITMQQRKERIEDILDERLGMIESGGGEYILSD